MARPVQSVKPYEVARVAQRRPEKGTVFDERCTRREPVGAACMVAISLASAFADDAIGQAAKIPFDTPTIVTGVETVCTGVGADAQSDPRWAAYPVKVVLAGKGGQYLGDAQLTVEQNGHAMVSVICGGPWTLFKLAPGHYHVKATVNGETETNDLYAPKTGQGRVIMRFPDQGGTVSPEYMPPMN